MAGHLAIKGFPVRLYNRSEKRIWGVISTGGIEMAGEDVEGFGAVKLATTSIEEAIRDVPLIMVVVPATGHRDIAEACAPATKARVAPEEAKAKARRLQAFVDKLYGGRKPHGVVDELIAERRREAAKEASE